MTEKAQVETVFGAAIAITSAQDREAFIDQACRDDPSLRREVDVLVNDYFRAGDFLQQPVAQISCPVIDKPISEGPGTVIGPYKLLEQIGEGGMGVVYMAEQTEPVRRQVALKIIKPGMDSRQVIARFETERQALAMMDHPNIAKVLDAGTTDTGRPYFVMELVKGHPITQYCDENRLTPRQRLELFLPVCQAIQHAHQKGLIHRDLKPSNILVARYDDRAVPKVIDFGVAKAVTQRLTETTLFTQYGQIVGTIEYMSPEQAQFSQLDVDTRSDIYSLGVLLYELLTGKTPIGEQRLRTTAFDDVLRIIREEDPPAPSTRFSDSQTLPAIAETRRTEPKKLSSLIRGELDWIVMKALEKDRRRRYQTVSSFATDVQNYLNDEAVEACPPSLAYRLKKLVRRNRRTVAAVVMVLIAFLLSGFSVGWMLRDRAARNAVIAAEVRQVLSTVSRLEEKARWNEALSSADHAASLVANIDGMDELIEQIERHQRDLEFVLQLEGIRLDQTKVVITENRFDLESARSRYEQVFQTWLVERSEPRHESIAQQIRTSPPRVQLAILAGLYNWRFVAAPQTKQWIDGILEAADNDAWRRRLRFALNNTESSSLLELASDDGVIAQPPAVISMLADTLISRGSHREASALLQAARREHPDDFWITFQSGLASDRSGNLQHAARHYSAALALRPNVLTAVALGSVVRRTGEPSQAVDIYRSVVEIEPEYVKGHYNLGNALIDLGRYEEAIESVKESLRLNPEFCRAWYRLGEAYRRAGRTSEALDAYQRAVELDSSDNSLPDQQLRPAHLNRMYELARHLEATQPQHQKEFAQLAESVLEMSQGNLEVGFQHAAQLVLIDRHGRYRQFCQDAVARFGETRNPRTANLLARMCTLCADNGVDRGRIERLARLALDDAVGANRLHTLGLAYLRADRFYDATAEFRRTLDFPWLARGAAYLGLAASCRQSGDIDGADRSHHQAVIWMRSDLLNIDSKLHPHDRAECRLLLREYETLLEQEAAGSESNSNEERKTESVDTG